MSRNWVVSCAAFAIASGIFTVVKAVDLWGG
jgi:hypothetical protein